MALTVALVAAVGLATPANAVSAEPITSFGSGAVTGSLSIGWNAADATSNDAYIGFALASAFSPSSPCDYNEWDQRANVSGNPSKVGYLTLQGLTNPYELTQYVNWTTSASIAVQPGELYVACFYADYNSFGDGGVWTATSANTVVPTPVSGGGASAVWTMSFDTGVPGCVGSGGGSGWVATPTCERPGSTLLGWSTSQAFPKAVAGHQVEMGWGTYDGMIGGTRMIFVPAGKPLYLSGTNTLYPVWAVS